MPFISATEELVKKSFTSVENKFITKYLAVLDANAVKVYLYALYLCQNGPKAYTLADLAAGLSISEENASSYFEYLEEFELCHIVSRTPFEVVLEDVENILGTPKKYKPEKYADFAKSVQNIIKQRMISTTEFREYFALIEEYGFDTNALLMIITYCVNMKGEDIRYTYIKKVAKSFAEDGATSAKKVEEKLSAYTSTTPALLKLFSGIGISRRPDVDDEKLYKKWTADMGFSEQSILCASKNFKAKSMERIDAALQELYKNRKFDVKEIEAYTKNKNSVFEACYEIARSLGVYMETPTPYVETYVAVWMDKGFEADVLKMVAAYSFTHGQNSFEGMNDFIETLYKNGIVAKEAVEEYLDELTAKDRLLKTILSTCGYTRKIIDFDRQSLTSWQNWGFGEDMILEAAKRSVGTKNPLSYMNAILSSWKQLGIFDRKDIPTLDQKPTAKVQPTSPTLDKAAIERHYAELRQRAEVVAERNERRALADTTYADLNKKLNSLSIQLAYAEVRDKQEAANLSEQIGVLEQRIAERLVVLGLTKESLSPQYACKICGDTGYDKNGKQCACLKKYLSENS
jgi:DNA replication protein DnaD